MESSFPDPSVLSQIEGFNNKEELTIQHIGSGTYGNIYLITNINTQQSIVIKVIYIYNTGINIANLIQNEIFILNLLKDHCNEYILCYHTTIYSMGYYYIITEALIDYVDLYDALFVEKIQFNLVQVINNLISGLLKLHSLDVAHNDITLGNIMIQRDTFKIKYIDFGASCYKEQCSKPSLGTIVYASPEIVSPIPSNIERLKKSDIWSLGLTIFEIITKHSLYEYVAPNVCLLSEVNMIQSLIELNKFFNSPDSHSQLVINQTINKYIPINIPDHDSIVSLLLGMLTINTNMRSMNLLPIITPQHYFY